MSGLKTLVLTLCVASVLGGVTHLDSAGVEEAIASGVPTFVKFYAPWCGHCKRLAPTWEQLSNEFASTKANVVSVDCTTAGAKAVCTSQSIRGFPTLKLFVNGETAPYQGKRDLKSLKAWLGARADVEVVPQSPKSSGSSITFARATMSLIAIFIAWQLFGPIPQGVKPPPRFSRIVPGSGNDQGDGQIHRSIMLPPGADLVTLPDKNTKTLWDNFQRGVRLNPHGKCLGHRPRLSADKVGAFVWESFSKINKRARNFGSGLEAFGLLPEVDGMRMLAFYMKNCPEWVVAEMGCFSQGGTTVPLYDTLGPDTVAYVINQTELTTVVCTAAEVPALLATKALAPSLTTVVQVGKVKAEEVEAAEKAGITLLSFAQVEAEGKAKEQPLRLPAPEAVATFCYTSGTTGKSKGALLTHANMVSDMAAVELNGIKLTKKDVHLSYLPLAHAFERVVQAACFRSGTCIGFYQGNTLKLMEDLAVLRPTVFPSVPRLLNKVYDKVMAGAQAGGIKTVLFNMAYKSKCARLKRGHLTHPVWDKLVFGKVAKKVGLDRVRIMITGSAPIAGHVMEFLRVVFSTVVVEGYGQTESAAAATLCHSDDYSCGHVGGPVACNEIKLVSVPEMGYNVTDTIHGRDEATGNKGIPCDGRGEICFRGPNIFKGYYKMPEKTAEAVDADGWCHSGDIGLWTLQGQIKIIDRKKNIFKLSQGEYVAAEKIENVYAKEPLAAQVFVYGDSFHHCLVGVIVPEEAELIKYAKANGLSTDMASLCDDESVKKMYLGRLRALGKEAKLRGFEHVRALHLCPELFSVDNDLLTPTFKLKRNELKKAFKPQLDAMYTTLGGVAGKTGVSQG